ncbi:sodium-dependent transporter [Marinobacterium marinum]|uniref:Transporter n=1 Tax=Marinobacterium marinum TaxID=2756129 RepID=A0A7W2AD04_9GAMM|nr:sodium-dependent transporter [Marinobacterium marinum]MBA4503082.1 sodium-dependent transporter [Marinobacterium marinum]
MSNSTYARSGRLPQQQWSTRFSFILAAAGASVGLGNIWKFPYVAGENGGGAFILVYLACIALLGVPMLMAEVLIGRRGQQNPVNSMATLAREAGASPAWKNVGRLGVMTGFLLLSFYVVVAGWALAYMPLTATGAFTGVEPPRIGQMFEQHLQQPLALIGWSTLVLVLTLGIVGRGVRQGLEKAANWLMPLLFLFLLILAVYAGSIGHFGAAVEFMFRPDFDKLSASGVLIALGHAFFTLSIGGGAMMIYGSYLSPQVSIARTSILVAVLDTAAALLAGLAIFPIVFAYGLEPGNGPGLIFVTLPIAFGQMPMGTVFGTLFFLMLSVAALTSAFSLIEPAIAWLTEKRGMSRFKASVLGGSGIWVLSLGTVFSFNIGADWTLAGKTFFEALDYLISGWMLPLGGLLMALFTAWVMKPEVTALELGGDSAGYRLWLGLIRFLVPAIIMLIFLQAIGLISL